MPAVEAAISTHALTLFSMTNSKFDSDFNELVAVAQASLAAFWEAGDPLARNSAVDSRIPEIAQYGVMSPGKRIRSVLTLACGEVLGVGPERLGSVVRAVEFLHASSLIHDDLPALDGDTLRRGRPTAHVVFGEGLALLGGDALIGLALESVATDPVLDAETRASLVALFSRAYVEVCVGQALDLRQTEEVFRDLTEVERAEALYLRHKKKTGALFSAACASSALIKENGEKSTDLSNFQAFGEELGVLFQITDDLLDATASTAELGKHAQTDSKLGKVTFTSLLGLDGAARAADQSVLRLRNLIAPYGARAEFLNSFVGQIRERKR